MAARSASRGRDASATGFMPPSASEDGWDEGLLWGYALLSFGCVSLAFFVCVCRLDDSI